MDIVQKSTLLSGFTIAITSIILLTLGNNVFAIEYENYTSEKYGIQFEYPSTWTVAEKTSRFDTGNDITIKFHWPSPSFLINYRDEGLEYDYGSSNIETATLEAYNEMIDTIVTYKFKSIQKPSFITIDNHKAGTFLLTMEKRYKVDPLILAVQQWITFVGDNGYTITFTDTTDTFDSRENTEIRNHFINSIKFLGDTELHRNQGLIENEKYDLN